MKTVFHKFKDQISSIWESSKRVSVEIQPYFESEVQELETKWGKDLHYGLKMSKHFILVGSSHSLLLICPTGKILFELAHFQRAFQLNESYFFCTDGKSLRRYDLNQPQDSFNETLSYPFVDQIELSEEGYLYMTDGSLIYVLDFDFNELGRVDPKVEFCFLQKIAIKKDGTILALDRNHSQITIWNSFDSEIKIIQKIPFISDFVHHDWLDIYMISNGYYLEELQVYQSDADKTDSTHIMEVNGNKGLKQKNMNSDYWEILPQIAIHPFGKKLAVIDNAGFIRVLEIKSSKIWQLWNANQTGIAVQLMWLDENQILFINAKEELLLADTKDLSIVRFLQSNL